MRTKPPTSRRSSSPHIDSLNVQKSSSSQDCPLKTLPTTKERKNIKSTNSDENSNAVDLQKPINLPRSSSSQSDSINTPKSSSSHAWVTISAEVTFDSYDQEVSNQQTKIY